MGDQSTIDLVRTVIAESLQCDAGLIAPETRLEDLARDSIQLFEVIIAFEKRLGATASYEDLVNIITVADVVEFIEQHPSYAEKQDTYSGHSVDIVVGEATEKDIPAVRALLVAEYHKQGYVTDDQAMHRADALFPFLGKPQTTTFVARYQGKIYGSMSLVLDSPEGFPMDAAFKSELDELRSQGQVLAEDCYMVVAADMRRRLHKQHRDMETLTKLFRLVVGRAQQKQVELLCGETNPKHELIYTALGFTTIGSQRPNPFVNGAPAIGKTLDLRNIEHLKQHNPALRTAFG